MKCWHAFTCILKKETIQSLGFLNRSTVAQFDFIIVRVDSSINFCLIHRGPTHMRAFIVFFLCVSTIAYIFLWENAQSSVGLRFKCDVYACVFVKQFNWSNLLFFIKCFTPKQQWWKINDDDDDSKITAVTATVTHIRCCFHIFLYSMRPFSSWFYAIFY